SSLERMRRRTVPKRKISLIFFPVVPASSLCRQRPEWKIFLPFRPRQQDGRPEADSPLLQQLLIRLNQRCGEHEQPAILKNPDLVSKGLSWCGLGCVLDLFWGGRRVICSEKSVKKLPKNRSCR